MAGEDVAAAGRLGYAYARSGRRDEARQLLAALQPSEGGAFGAAWIHLRLGERDTALARLTQAVNDCAAEMIYLKADPLYDGLRDDSRFAELLKRVSLSPDRR